MNRKFFASLAVVAVLGLSACGTGGDSRESVCESIKTIATDLAATLELIAADFSNSQNDQLASSLDDLRNLNPSDVSLKESKQLLEDSLESLMSDLNENNSFSASEDVTKMSTAIQSFTAACSN